MSIHKSIYKGFQRMNFSTHAKQSQYHLILFGAPGVGKGTHSNFLEHDLNFGHFSMGNYFRNLLS